MKNLRVKFINFIDRLTGIFKIEEVEVEAYTVKEFFNMPES